MFRRDLLAGLGDRELLRGLAAHVGADRVHTAELLAYIAEVDARKLYLREAYPSMHAYCVGELHFSDDAAAKRIHAAKAARDHRALFEAVAGGRLHLSAVVLLAPHLTKENAVDLIAAATHKRKWEIEQLLAERFPRPDVPTWIRAVAPTTTHQGGRAIDRGLPQLRHSPALSLDVTPLSESHAPGRVSLSEPEQECNAGLDEQLTAVASNPLPRGVAVSPTAPMSTASSFAPLAPEPPPRALIAPLAPQRFKLQVTIGQSTHDLLRRAQLLLSHRVPAGDVDQVLERALELLVQSLEKSRFGATDRPRTQSRRPKTGSRHIPAAVKRAVRARDGEQCTFVSDNGRRCEARRDLEFDHIREFTRGGEATVEGIRLRCRAHNQFTAEATFGAGFMHEKREARRRRRAAGATAARRAFEPRAVHQR